MQRNLLSSLPAAVLFLCVFPCTSRPVAARSSPAQNSPAQSSLVQSSPVPSQPVDAPQAATLPAGPAKANPFQPGQKLLAVKPDSRPASDEPASSDRCNRARDRDGSGVLSDTGGTDIKLYLGQLGRIVYAGWRPLIPKEADKPFYKVGKVNVCFSLLPSGKVEPGSIVVSKTSGDPALDRAASGAIGVSIFPPLPKDFTGQRLTLLYNFEYNPKRRPDPTRNLPQPPNPLGPVALTVGYTSKL